VDDLNTVHFDRVICDEGHALKNGYGTRRFTELARINSVNRWILSGTPVQNKTADYINLVSFISADGITGRQEALDAAHKLILRRVVRDVRDTVDTFPEEPPRHFVHPVTMRDGGEEKDVFDRLVSRFKDAIEEQVSQWVVLELYLRIRQFLAYPQIYVDAMKRKYAEYKRDAWTATSSKMEKFGEVLGSLEVAPTIVFTTFCGELEAASATLKKRGYRVWEISGSVRGDLREYALHSLHRAVEAGERNVALVMNIQSGNAGLNLQYMSRVVFLSSHWNPSIMDQAVGRAYRIGQTRSVDVHHILLADGAEKNLDRYIVKMHGNKRSIAKSVHEKLVCDAAADAPFILGILNAVVPDEVPDELDSDTTTTTPTD
jgi:SNF2 family DNA or RNA helicase